MNQYHYILCVRSGKRLKGIAGTNSGGCLAASETVFSANGLVGDACRGSVELQKNYTGRSASFVEIEMEADEISLAWFKKALAAPYYASLARFIESFPDAERFSADLSKVKR